MSTKPIQSPSYPALSLEESLRHVAKIEGTYRTSAADRSDAARLIGYSGLSGPANQTLAALASYGLVDRAGKGMMRVTPLAISILHPKSENEKRAALIAAATTPALFQEIREQFPDLPVPPEAGIITHLNRAGFNPSAVPKAARAFLSTARYVEELGASESRVVPTLKSAEPEFPENKFGGAAVGDLVQWESEGALQFEGPRRVRWVSEDGAWLAVEGSDTGIPMGQVTVEQVTPPKPPIVPQHIATASNAPVEKGFSEWFRAKVGADKIITINFKGEGDIGPKEIEKMIRVLEAQKAALED